MKLSKVLTTAIHFHKTIHYTTHTLFLSHSAIAGITHKTIKTRSKLHHHHHHRQLTVARRHSLRKIQFKTPRAKGRAGLAFPFAFSHSLSVCVLHCNRNAICGKYTILFSGLFALENSFGAESVAKLLHNIFG